MRLACPQGACFPLPHMYRRGRRSADDSHEQAPIYVLTYVHTYSLGELLAMLLTHCNRPGADVPRFGFLLHYSLACNKKVCITHTYTVGVLPPHGIRCSPEDIAHACSGPPSYMTPPDDILPHQRMCIRPPLLLPMSMSKRE